MEREKPNSCDWCAKPLGVKPRLCSVPAIDGYAIVVCGPTCAERMDTRVGAPSAWILVRYAA